MTLPLELISKYPPGQLHSPYQDYAELAKDKELVKQFRLPGCNECHGGGGGGGFCPALSQGVWFWGNTDDVLFRLIAWAPRASKRRASYATNWAAYPAPMPPMASPSRARTSLEDHRLHPVDQSAWNQSAREGDPGQDGSSPEDKKG